MKRQKKTWKKKKKKGSIPAFLKPWAATVASTIAKPAPIHSHKLPQSPTKSPCAIHANLQPEEDLDEITIHRPITNNFVKHLWTLVNGLPESIPEGSKFDKLAYFVCNSKDFDDPTVDADELWEMGLNNTLKSVFGWGSEQNMDDIIQHGKWGLDGLVKFVTYFIEERGMSEGLFEGKLEFLMKELEKKSAMASTNINGVCTAAMPMVEISNLVSTTNVTSTTQTLPVEDAIIDVDAMFEYEDTRVKKHQKSMTACTGYTLTFPDGMSPHTAYPFALHNTLIVPWDYSIKNGTIVLFVQSCTGFRLFDGDAKRQYFTLPHLFRQSLQDSSKSAGLWNKNHLFLLESTRIWQTLADSSRLQQTPASSNCYASNYLAATG